MNRAKTDVNITKRNVSGMNISISSHEEIDILTYGEIKEDGSPVFDSNYNFELSDKGLFSEKIFGKSSFTDDNKGRQKTGYPERNYRFGHISTPFYVSPLLYKSWNIMAKLLTCTKPKRIEKILSHEAYLVFIPDTCEATWKFKTVDELAKLKIDFLVPPMGYEGGFYYFEIKELDTRNTAKRLLIETFNDIKDLPDVYITSGAYSAIFLLLRTNFAKELKRTHRYLEEFNKKHKSSGTKADYNRVYATANRYRILTNLVKQNRKPIDLVSDKLLVLPAGLRDITLIKDNTGEVKPNRPKINTVYSSILAISKDIQRLHSINRDLRDIFSNPGNLEWVKEIPMTEKQFNSMNGSLINLIDTLFNEHLIEEIGKKQGKIRQAVFSKRMDYTATSVITPDPNLKLYQIGVPVRILIEFFEKRLSKTSKEQNFNKLKRKFKSSESYYTHSVKYDNISEDGIVNLVNNNASLVSDEINIIKNIEDLVELSRILSIRFPSLHRFSLLGYKIKPVLDNTIHLHPLLCGPYNADFDGDTMAQYLIETSLAINEVDSTLLPSKNLFDSNGEPNFEPSQDAVLGLHYLTMAKDLNVEPVKKYTSYNSMLRDYEMRRIGLHDVVEVKIPKYNNSEYNRRYHDYLLDNKYGKQAKYEGIDYFRSFSDANNPPEKLEAVIMPDYVTIPYSYHKSTVGRFIFNAYIPQDLGYVNRDSGSNELEMDKYIESKGKYGIDKKIIRSLIVDVLKNKSTEESVFFADGLKDIGYKYATVSGVSFSLNDIKEYKDKQKMIDKTIKDVMEIEKDTSLTKAQKRESKIDMWRKTNDELTDKSIENLDPYNPIKMMSQSGARGNRNQVSQMLAMRGFMSDPSGNIIDTPIISSLSNGLSMSEYFVSSYGTRKGMFDRSNSTKDTGAMTRTLIHGSSQNIILEGDCGDTYGALVMPLKNKEDKIILDLFRRVNGKVLCEPLVDEDGDEIARIGEVITDEHKDFLNTYCSESGIRVRTPLSCKSKKGLCAKCYGKYLGANRFSRVGDAVSIVSSQAIGERSTQLTMRTFHTGGSAEGDITHAFKAASGLLTTSQVEILADSFLGDTEVPSIEEVQLAVKENILKYKEIEDHTIEGYEFSYKDFGVLEGDILIDCKKYIKDSIQSIFASDGIELLDTHYEVIVKSMFDEFVIVDAGDSAFGVSNQILWEDLVVNNIALVSKGLNPIVARVKALNMKASGVSLNKPLLSVVFRELKSSLSRAIAYKSECDIVNPVLPVAFSNKIINPESMSEYKDLVLEDKYSKVMSNDEFLEWAVRDEVPEEIIEKTKIEATDLTWNMEEPIEEPSTEQGDLQNTIESLFNWDLGIQEEEDSDSEGLDTNSIFNFNNNLFNIGEIDPIDEEDNERSEELDKSGYDNSNKDSTLLW